ncbi:MAG: VCBS repeat-containing protein, partial [Deltaproteobacteria bacterium]|nr:VCBS repeat-containing protein [Deltaproteobacteria bacterium]
HHLSTTPVVQREFSAQIVPSGMSEGQVCGGGACVALYASLSFLPLSFALDQAAGPLTSAILGERSEDQNDVRVAFAELGAQSIGLAEVQCQGECNVRTFGLGGESTVALADGSRASGVAEDYLGATVALGGPRFFDVEGDGDQDLLVWAEDDAGHKGLGVLYNMDDATSSNPRRLVGTCQATQCDLAGLDTCSDDDTVKVYATEFFSASGVDPGDLLAVGQLDDAGFVDLVTTTGIYLASGSGPSCGFDADFQYRSFGWVPSVGDWTEAVVGDFNGDGIGDVAAFSAGIPQIEIYRGNAAGALTRLVLDTDQAPTAISAGDLDADGADEVVFAVDLDLDDDENDTSDIRVRWGSKAGRELSARSVGQSFRVGPRGLAMGAALTDLQAFDGDAELFIAGTFDSGFAGEGQTTIAVVQGSANRALASSVFSFLSTLVTAYGLDPLVPSMVEPTELDGWERRAWCVGTVAAGRFFDNQGSLDVATFGSLVPVVDGGTNREICDSSELVRFPILEGRRGAGNGNLDAQPPWCEPMPISEICPRSSQMTAINVDDDDYDELIIVAPEPGELGCSIAEDKTSNQILFSVPSGSQLPSASSCVGTFEPSAIGTVAGVLRRIERGSFDAEPGQDLLVTTSSEIAFLPSSGTELATPTAISGLPAEGCSIQASRTVVAGCSAERFLVVLQSCDGQADLALWAVDWADGPIATRATELPIGAVEIAEGAETDVVVGDVNGDGLGDVFARVADSGFFLIASDAPAVGTQDVCQRLD